MKKKKFKLEKKVKAGTNIWFHFAKKFLNTLHNEAAISFLASFTDLIEKYR